MEDLGCDDHVPFGGDPVGDATDVMVDAEDLLEDHDGGVDARCRRSREIPGHRERSDRNFDAFVGDLHRANLLAIESLAPHGARRS
jgi:hypothetical protein